MSSPCQVVHTPDHSSLTPSQIAQLETVIELSFRGKVAQLCPYKIEERLLNCGAFYQCHTDGRHFWRVNSSRCSLHHLCLDCAAVHSSELIRRYTGVQKILPQDGFTYICVPVQPGQDVKSALDQATGIIASNCPRAATLAILKPASRAVEVIYAGQLTLAAASHFQSFYPDFTYQRFRPESFTEQLKRWARVDLHPDPQQIVESWESIQGVRTLRVNGMSKEEKLTVYHEEVLYTDNNSGGNDHPQSDPPPAQEASSSDPPHSHIPSQKCPICGSKSVRATLWMHCSTKLHYAEMDWQDISPPTIQ